MSLRAGEALEGKIEDIEDYIERCNRRRDRFAVEITGVDHRQYKRSSRAVVVEHFAEVVAGAWADDDPSSPYWMDCPAPRENYEWLSSIAGPSGAGATGSPD